MPGSGSSPGGGNGNHLSSCLENPMDRGAWWTTVHGVAQNEIGLQTCMSWSLPDLSNSLPSPPGHCPFLLQGTSLKIAIREHQ